MFYLDNGDGTYTYYIRHNDGTTTAVVVYDKEGIPKGYVEGIFIQEELL